MLLLRREVFVLAVMAFAASSNVDATAASTAASNNSDEEVRQLKPSCIANNKNKPTCQPTTSNPTPLPVDGGATAPPSGATAPPTIACNPKCLPDETCYLGKCYPTCSKGFNELNTACTGNGIVCVSSTTTTVCSCEAKTVGCIAR